MKRNCDHTIEYLYQYMDQELTWYRRSRVQWHLRKCATCGDGHQFERQVKLMVQNKCTETPPPELIDRLRTFLEENTRDQKS